MENAPLSSAPIGRNAVLEAIARGKAKRAGVAKDPSKQ
jgi:hypothetical protein